MRVEWISPETILLWWYFECDTVDYRRCPLFFRRKVGRKESGEIAIRWGTDRGQAQGVVISIKR